MTHAAPARRASRYRQTVGALAIVVSVVLAASIGGLPLYVFPHTDDPQHAEVALVLGTPTRAKVQLAQELAESGVVDRVVISVARYGTWAGHNLTVCTAELRYNVDCYTPVPHTTQGEARMLLKLSQGWRFDSAVIIAATPHISRARMLFERCFRGDLYMVDAAGPRTTSQWVGQYLYQTGAFAKALLDPAC